MSKEIIKISIIVPIYNVENYVKPCIESIIGQTYRNLEIILVDDGSTDRCPEMCDNYAKKDERIHVIHKRNGGVTSARKAGIAVATGDYVLGVDGDDWIEKDRVEVLVRDGILSTYADMIYLSGYIMDFGEDGTESTRQDFDIPIKLFKHNEIEHEIFPLLPSGEIYGALWAWAIRRELLLRNQMLIDDHVTLEEDLLCVIFCLLEAKSAMTIQQGGYHYIQRTSSIVHQVSKLSNKDFLQMKSWHQGLKNQLEQKYVSEKIYKICGRLAMHIIMVYYNYDYNLFLNGISDYLSIFPSINCGARIVVYGAGKLGYRLVQSLDKTKKCSVTLWVDQNQNRPTVPGYTISSRDAIFSADYDFIVVAILNAAVAEEVRRSLILDGIPEERIATMDIGAILKIELPEYSSADSL